jgi:hypothetical protein
MMVSLIVQFIDDLLAEFDSDHGVLLSEGFLPWGRYTPSSKKSRTYPFTVYIEAGAHLGIAGDILDMEDRPEIVLLGDPSPLESQHGRVFDSHHGETGHEDIVKPDGGIPFARVSHALEAFMQDGQHGIQAQILPDSRCCWCLMLSIFHGA